MVSNRYVGKPATYRMGICRECGLNWIISVWAAIPKGGYICPKCRAKKREKV